MNDTHIGYVRNLSYIDPLFAQPAEVSANDFEFKLFRGSVSICVGGRDVSPKPDWIPIIGFATSFVWAVKHASPARPGRVLLMENEDELEIRSSGGLLTVSTNYANFTGTCRQSKLLEESKQFARKAIQDFRAQSPIAGASDALTRLWRHADLGPS